MLGTDGYGTWLGVAAGTPARRGLEPEKALAYDFVKLVAGGGWAAPMWNAGGDFALYVDIVTPARWDGNRVTMVDLDLDVIQLVDGSVYVDDEDEFVEHQQTLGYPPEIVAAARAATAQVIAAIGAGTEPYATAGPQRLADWVARRTS